MLFENGEWKNGGIPGRQLAVITKIQQYSTTFNHIPFTLSEF
jgi:hypothetical protein